MPPKQIKLKGDKYTVSLHQYPIPMQSFTSSVCFSTCTPTFPLLLLSCSYYVCIPGPSANFSFMLIFCLLRLKCEQQYHYNKYRLIISIFWLLWSPALNKGSEHHAVLLLQRLDPKYSSQANSIHLNLKTFSSHNPDLPKVRYTCLTQIGTVRQVIRGDAALSAKKKA